MLHSSKKENVSVGANDAPNVAVARGNMSGDMTPHGCGVGKSLIVSVAAVDAAERVRYS